MALVACVNDGDDKEPTGRACLIRFGVQKRRTLRGLAVDPVESTWSKRRGDSSR
jgi:hypothetical protein